MDGLAGDPEAAKGLFMNSCRIAASLILMSFAAYAQTLDDAAIGKLVKAGIGEQTIVAMINEQPGKYDLSADDMAALKKAGVSDRILAAMVVRAGTKPPGPNRAAAPAALVVHDATPVRLRLTRDINFSNIRPSEFVTFEILDDLRIDSLLVMAHGTRILSTVIQAEPKTRMGRGGKLGLTLSSVPLLNGDKLAIRVTKEAGGASGPAEATKVGAASLVAPADPCLLFSFGKDEAFREGTTLVVYTDGDSQLNPARFLQDVAFTSNPPGAMVHMYGTPVGRTPFVTRLAPGVYQALFSIPGYSDLNETLTVGPGYSNTVHAPFEMKP